MKIQFSQGNTPETNQVYEKLLNVSGNAYTNESSQELSFLSKEQQKIIFDILNEIDLSTVELRKNLFRRIEGDPKIAKVVHLAITSTGTIEADYLAFDQELIRSHIDTLQEIVIKTPRLRDKCQLVQDFWNKYRGLFDKKALEWLSTDELYQLISLLAETDVLTLPNHKTVLQGFPENGKKYYKALQLDPSKFWMEICEIHPSASEDRLIALSHYISSHKTPFTNVQSLISSDDLSKLLPYLRFGNFAGVDDAVITSTLQKATRLQEIYINSRTITTLPKLPSCTYLHCHACFSLKALPALPSCNRLVCSHCRDLTELPALPKCMHLDCSSCSGLTELPALPECMFLDCCKCLRLTALPELPVCQEIYCNFCLDLQVLPQTFPACQIFRCENCPSLSGMMPEVPLAAQVYTGNSSPLEFIQLEVNLEEFAENPRKLLFKLGDHLLQNKPFPNIYYRLNGKRSEAIDIGGVRRDFISRLMESLFKEGASNGNLLINFEKFPQLNNQEDIDGYRTIGRIFALCYPENSYFKTGALFSSELYKKISFLADASLAAIDIASDENVVSTYLHYRNFAEFLKLIDRNDDNIQDIKNDVLTHAYAFVNMEGDVEAAQSFFEKKENRDLLKTETIEAAKSDPQFQAIRFIAQEMKKTLDAADSWNLFHWNLLHQQEASKIQERIEGVLSKESLLNKLEWEETSSSASIDQELKDTTKGYLKSWIERASIEDLRKFVRAVSSNNTLGPNMLKIQLFNRGPQFIPVAHTCFFTLELSADYPSQEIFDNKLNVLLTEGMAGSGFQIA